MNYVSVEGQGHFLTLSQGHLCMKNKTRRRRHRRHRPSTILNVFSSETAWPIKVKFHVEPP